MVRRRSCTAVSVAAYGLRGSTDGIWSYPTIRATSSTKSAGICRSPRQEGGSTFQLLVSTSQPTVVSAFSITSFDSSVPKRSFTYLGSKSMIAGYLSSPETAVPT